MEENSIQTSLITISVMLIAVLFAGCESDDDPYEKNVVYLLDIKTNTTSILTDSNIAHLYPSIDHGNAVWMEAHRKGEKTSYCIILYNITRNETTVIKENIHPHFPPVVKNNFMVWSEWAQNITEKFDYRQNIWLYNISSGDHRLIRKDVEVAYLKLSGHFILWQVFEPVTKIANNTFNVYNILTNQTNTIEIPEEDRMTDIAPDESHLFIGVGENGSFAFRGAYVCDLSNLNYVFYGSHYFDDGNTGSEDTTSYYVFFGVHNGKIYFMNDLKELLFFDTQSRNVTRTGINLSSFGDGNNHFSGDYLWQELGSSFAYCNLRTGRVYGNPEFVKVSFDGNDKVINFDGRYIIYLE